MEKLRDRKRNGGKSVEDHQKKDEKHIIKDSRKRSFLKALTGNGLEVLIDTLLLSFILFSLGVSSPVPISFALSVITEILCFVTNYCNDRIWNLFQYGREIIHEEGKRKNLIFPKVIWREPTKEDEHGIWEMKSWYYPNKNEIHLLIGRIDGSRKLFITLCHESFHWITNLIIRYEKVWEPINLFYDKMDSLLFNVSLPIGGF